MGVEVRISADEATAHGGTLTVDDQQGTNSTTVVSATLDDRITTAEITIPLTLAESPAVLPLWTVEPNNGANTVTYRARLKKWYLRP